MNYTFELAYKNTFKQANLTALIVLTISLGIAACVITYALIYLMSADPLPTKSARVLHVQLDNWDPNKAAIEPNLPPEQVTWKDATNIVAAKQAKYQAASAITWGMVTPTDKNAAPFLGVMRATHGEFFPMFNVPFLYGQGWQNAEPNEAKYVTVLTKEVNERVFSGENSIGKTLPMLGKIFTVVGVLDDWHPSPKFYDMVYGAFSKPEDLYIPFQIKAELELPHGGITNCWETNLGDSYQGFLNSECTNFELWVEVDELTHLSDYEFYLNSYVQQQKQLGRFARPINNILLDINQWLSYKRVVSKDIYVFFSLALLFLFVCLVNAASLISTKFTASTHEVALRRALGANQQNIFLQSMIEAMILGVLGGVFGLIFSLFGLQGISYLYPNFSTFLTLDLTLISFAFGLSILSSLISALGPIWFLNRTPIAKHLT
ncbi:ABC transporter permease [uncultured Paraglaciecola sp.]|uniref:ABC transporter permease n=1 Tax=uncultured Paraglaciecola sp. TaxID=1765024 RepID=UPI002596FA53|nr:ABC transporter permease [uncultured Paraglaciecola sp.]